MDKLTGSTALSAIQLLASECSHCGCKIIGHGIGDQGVFYFRAHCAGHAGVQKVADRNDQPAKV
jgi:hypothetical protein